MSRECNLLRTSILSGGGNHLLWSSIPSREEGRRQCCQSSHATESWISFVNVSLWSSYLTLFFFLVESCYLFDMATWATEHCLRLSRWKGKLISINKQDKLVKHLLSYLFNNCNARYVTMHWQTWACPNNKKIMNVSVINM